MAIIIFIFSKLCIKIRVISQQKQNICLPTNVLFLFIQAAGLAYHHDAVVYIISPTGCISSRASVYLFCGLMIYNTSC